MSKLVDISILPDDKIQLEVDMTVGIGGDRWPGAMTFCRLIANLAYRYSVFHDIFTDKKVIELGSGTGLVSIVLKKLFQMSHIVASDLDSHVSLIQRNVQRNIEMHICKTSPESNQSSTTPSSSSIVDIEDRMIARITRAAVDDEISTGSNISVVPFDWCRPNWDIGKFDVILAFECVYREDLFQPLVESLAGLASKDSVIILGITRMFAKISFFELLKKFGFKYTMLNGEFLQQELESSNTAMMILTKYK